MIDWILNTGFDSILLNIADKNGLTIIFLLGIAKLIAKYFIPGDKDDKFLVELEDHITGDKDDK